MPTDTAALEQAGAGTRVRVLVADDHPLVCAAIRSTLEDGGFDVCAEADDADSAVAAALRERPAICLLDVNMPGGGIRAAAQIVAELPGTAVVMVSAVTDTPTVVEAVRAGAVGYLPKSASFARLPEALHGVLRGEAAVPRELTARLLVEFRRRDRLHHHQPPGHLGGALTAREADVLELLHEGCTTAEISARLYLSATTVRTHVASLLRKYGVRDREALRELVGRE